jgi:hypothetical protein
VAHDPQHQHHAVSGIPIIVDHKDTAPFTRQIPAVSSAFLQHRVDLDI